MKKALCFTILSALLMLINHYAANLFEDEKISWSIMPYVWNGIFIISFFAFIRLIDLIPALVVILCCSLFNHTIGMKIAVEAFEYHEWVLEQESIINWLLYSLLKAIRTLIVVWICLLVTDQLNHVFEWLKGRLN